jgi:RHS repeat-associated protein
VKSAVGYAYYRNDHLGMPQQVVGKNGGKVWEGEYRAFGGVKVETGSLEQRLRFAGQYFDQETGNYYNYFRDYDPSTGRYTQSDPIGLQGGLNLYNYTFSGPSRWIDALGLSCSSWVAVGYGPDSFRYGIREGEWSEWSLILAQHIRQTTGGALLTCVWERQNTIEHLMFVDKTRMYERICTNCDGTTETEIKSEKELDKEGTVVNDEIIKDIKREEVLTWQADWVANTGARARGLCITKSYRRYR